MKGMKGKKISKCTGDYLTLINLINVRLAVHISAIRMVYRLLLVLKILFNWEKIDMQKPTSMLRLLIA